METILNSLGKPLKHIIRGKDSKPIILNARLQQLCDNREAKIMNDFGFDVPITTMTAIAKKVSEQRHYTVGKPGKPGRGPSDYMQIRAGSEGAWADQITTFRSYSEGDAFETGYTNMAQDDGRVAQVNAGVDAVPVKNNDWAKGIGWNIMQLQKAMRAMNWDYIEALERSLKKNYDLGIQRIAFLGANGFNGKNGTILGLLNQPSVKVSDTGIISKFISLMDVNEFQTFVAKVVGEFQENCDFTDYPNRFIMPQNDYNGMMSAASAQFPNTTKMEFLLNAFRKLCGEEFEILPLAYANADKNSLGPGGTTGLYAYALYNGLDEEAGRMDVPVPYTGTVPNSNDGFTLRKVSYSQHTGFMAYQPTRFLYFQFPAA